MFNFGNTQIQPNIEMLLHLKRIKRSCTLNIFTDFLCFGNPLCDTKTACQLFIWLDKNTKLRFTQQLVRSRIEKFCGKKLVAIFAGLAAAPGITPQ